MNLEELLGGSEYGLFTGANLFTSAPAKEAIIENFLYERDVICISSKAGVGKSILAQQLMCALTSGTPFLDTLVVPRACNVLYIQTEGDRTETLERLTLMTSKLPINNSRWAHLNLPGIGLNIESEFNQMVNLIRTTTGMLFHVIIIDPLYTTIKGDMSRNEVATDWIRNIRSLKTWMDCAVIVLNHEGKDVYNEGVPIDRGNAAIFGSTFWSAFFNVNYRLKLFDGHHLLEIGKNRSGKSIDRLVMQLVTDETLMYVPHNSDLSENGNKIISVFKQNVACTARKIIEVSGVSQAQTYRILKRLEEQGKIERDYRPEGTFFKLTLDKTIPTNHLTNTISVV